MKTRLFSVFAFISILLFLSSCSEGSFTELNRGSGDPKTEDTELNKFILPKVINVLVNGQAPLTCNSMIRNISVEVDREFEFLPGLFLLIRQHDGAIVNPVIEKQGKKLQLILPASSESPGIEGISLGTGKWEVYLDYSKIIKIKDKDLVTRIEKIATLGRLFADANNNCYVGVDDFILFRMAFGSYNSGSPFDSDGDGYISTIDFVAFRMAFGTSLDELNSAPIPLLPPTPPVIAGTPVGNFSVSKVFGKAPLIVDFIDTSEGKATKWNWYFGVSGKSTSKLQNPTYIFTRNGDYQVTLIPENEKGKGRPKTIEIHVGDPLRYPKAEFTTAGSSHWHHSINLQFVDESIDARHWFWDFGDGKTSTERNPTHLYDKEGKYTVALRVTNYLGEDTETKNEFVVLDGESNTFQFLTEQDLVKRMTQVSYPSGVNLFTNYDPANLKYVRNPEAWTKDMDLTGLVVWNSSTGGPQKGGTLISKRQIVTANHWTMAPGTTVHFVDENGITVKRRVINSHQYITDPGLNSDANIQELDEDVPETVHPIHIMSQDTLRRVYQAEKELPLRVFHTNQQARALPIDVLTTLNGVTMQYTTSPELMPYSQPVIPGDSGSGIFTIIGGKPVLVSAFFGPLGGPSYFDLFPNLVESILSIGDMPTVITEKDLQEYLFWE